jgi:pantothenate synthetase
MQALTLSKAIRQAEALFVAGERHPDVLLTSARRIFAAEPAIRVHYIELVDWTTLEPMEVAAPGGLFAVAASVGPTRLIDNTILA